MISLILKIKNWLVGAAAAILLIAAYLKGAQTEKNKTAKGNLDAAKKAKQARDNLRDPASTHELHDKYKR